MLKAIKRVDQDNSEANNPVFKKKQSWSLWQNVSAVGAVLELQQNRFSFM